ncbi:unnamed protein product, partial [marine sediment metagenome]
TEDAADILAAGLPATAQRLNAALSELAAAVGSEPIDARAARHYVENHTPEQVTLKTIAAAVAGHFEVKVGGLRGPTRRQAVVRARGVAMYLARELTGKSFAEIGRYFGRRDHTTVMHACNKTALLRQEDEEIRQALERLEEKVGGTPCL